MLVLNGLANKVQQCQIMFLIS